MIEPWIPDFWDELTIGMAGTDDGSAGTSGRNGGTVGHRRARTADGRPFARDSAGMYFKPRTLAVHHARVRQSYRNESGRANDARRPYWHLAAFPGILACAEFSRIAPGP